MSPRNENSSQGHIPGPDEPSIPQIEDDDTIPPRPEEELADVLRAPPDIDDHSQHSE